MPTIILPRGCPINGVKSKINEIVDCAKKQHPEWDNFDRDTYFFSIDEKFIITHSECFKYEMKEFGINGLVRKYNGRIAFEIYGDWPQWVLTAIGEVSRGKRIDRW